MAQGKGPPVWGSPTAIDPANADGEGFGLPNAMEAGKGLGGALGYWLPKGIVRARAATKRFKTAIR